MPVVSLAIAGSSSPPTTIASYTSSSNITKSISIALVVSPFVIASGIITGNRLTWSALAVIENNELKINSIKKHNSRCLSLFFIR